MAAKKTSEKAEVKKTTAKKETAAKKTTSTKKVSKIIFEIGGKQIDYTATTGTIALESDLGQYEIFFTAYTANGADAVARIMKLIEEKAPSLKKYHV